MIRRLACIVGFATVVVPASARAQPDPALPKVIVRDPIKGFLEHVDLVSVRKGETVTVEVPIHLVGDAGPETLVDQQTMTLTVSADATALPEFVELSIQGKRAGSSLHASDVKLPSGTELAQDPEHVIVAFLGVQSEEELEAELAEAEAELGSGQAGAEAIAEAEAEEAGDTGSESDKAGEGDEVGETDAPKSETPAQ